MENEEKEVVKEKKKGKTIAIILLVLPVLGMGSYIAYDKYFSKQINNPKEEKEEKKDKKEEKNKIEEIDIDSEEVKNLLEDLYVYNFGDELYKKEKFDVLSMPVKYKIIPGAHSCSYLDGRTYYTWVDAWNEKKGKIDLSNLKRCSIDDFNNSLKLNHYNGKISLNDIKQLDYNKDFGYYSLNLDDGTYNIFLDKDDIIVTADPYDNTGPYAPESGISTKTVKAEKSNNKLYIYEKVAFLTYEYVFEDSPNPDILDRKTTCYSDVKRKDKKQVDIEEEDINFDLYNTYKYTFDLEEGNYYFSSVELVK